MDLLVLPSSLSLRAFLGCANSCSVTRLYLFSKNRGTGLIRRSQGHWASNTLGKILLTGGTLLLKKTQPPGGPLKLLPRKALFSLPPAYYYWGAIDLGLSHL